MIDALVRSTAVLAGGFALVGMCASRSAAVRHWILAATLVGAALVMPASLFTPTWTVALPSLPSLPAPHAAPAPVTATSGSAVVTAPRAASRPSRTATLPIALLVWAAGFATMLAMIAIGVTRLSRLSARAMPVSDPRWHVQARALADTYRIRGPVALSEADAAFVPATWGTLRPHILLPRQARDWTADRIHAVLCHELAHVARADWLVHLASQICVAALWFNPLAWIAARHLRREAEQACDDAVLDRGIEAADYAMHLVALARDCRRPSWALIPALLMAPSSAFERRISAMLNPRLDRSPLTRRAAGAFAAAALVLTFTAAAVRAVPAQPTALSGTVYDPTGAVLPGVAMTLADPQEHTVKATTDPSGRFSFPGIGSGRYVLTAALPGFRDLRDEFDLKSVPDWDRAVTLQVGTVRETIHVSAARMPSGGAPAAGAAAAPVRVRVGGNVRAPRKELDVHPVYPTSMRATGREGEVPIEAIIGRDGMVSSVRVVSAQVHPDFAIAAVDAVRQWRFTPTLLNGQPVEVVMMVTVRFSLSD